MSNELEVKGFVLQINPVKEQDCYLHILTKTQGHLAIYVKGGLNPKSRLQPLCQLFQLVNLQLYRTEKTNYLQDGEVEARFSVLAEQLQLQAYAGKTAHLVKDLTQGQECDFKSIYEILAYALHALNQSGADGELLLAMAALRLLYVSGFALPVNVAEVGTGEDVYCNQLSFRRPHPQSQVLHPPAVRGEKSALASPPLLSQGTKEAISFILTAPLARIFRLQNLGESIRIQLIAFSRHFVVYCLDKDYQGDQFLQQLQEMEALAQNLWRKRQAE